MLQANHNEKNSSRIVVVNNSDIYDVTTNTWSVAHLSIISVNNTVYLAGGKINGVLSDKVWKLEF